MVLWFVNNIRWTAQREVNIGRAYLIAILHITGLVLLTLEYVLQGNGRNGGEKLILLLVHSAEKWLNMTFSLPTVALVHGAWHTPANYQRYIDVLRARGFTVHCPHLPSCSDHRLL